MRGSKCKRYLKGVKLARKIVQSKEGISHNNRKVAKRNARDLWIVKNNVILQLAFSNTEEAERDMEWSG